MGGGRFGSRFRIRWNRRPVVISPARLPGSELVRLGGGETVPTPMVPSLPVRDGDRHRGLCGETLALPPAEARILNDIQLVVGENVLRTRSGSLVSWHAMDTAVTRLPRSSESPAVSLRLGSAALHGVAGAGTFERLVEAVPVSLLLQHPALRAWAPIALVNDGRAGLVESYLLAALQNHQVRLDAVSPGSIVEPEVVVLPSPVARSGGGALPRWYRRWLDQEARRAGDSPGVKRLLLTHGPRDPLLSHAQTIEQAEDNGFVQLDTLTGALGDDSTVDGEQLVALLRDAHAVIGASDEALAHALVCRRAKVIQVVHEDTISPRVAQLAASRALPYDHVVPARLGEVLTD